MAADLHFGDFIQVQSWQRKWQGEIWNSKYSLGQVKTFFGSFSVGLNKNNPKIHRKKRGSIQKHCWKNKSTSSNLDDR